MADAEVLLPRPTPEDEDRFIAALTSADPETVALAARRALRAGRPALAARALGLLGEVPTDPELDKARRAADLLLLQGGREAEIDAHLDWILERLRADRMKRARRRQRDKLRAKARDPLKRRPRK